MPTTNHHHHHHVFNNNQSPPQPKPNPKLLSLILKLIIMSLIFLLFLGVAAIALLHIFLAGSFLHRHLHLHLHLHRPPPSSTTTTTAYSLDDLQKYLPPFKYASPNNKNNKDCSICLENFKEGDWCRTLPVCQHVFHVNCVEPWLTKVSNCPICRNQVRCASGSIIRDDDDYKLLWAIGVSGQW